MALMQIIWQTMGAIFGAHPITLSDIGQLQAKSPNIIVYILPVVVLVTVIECIGGHIGNHHNYERKETIGSLLIGIGSLIANLAMKTILMGSAVWIYNLLPWRMELNWYLLLPCFVAYDFCSYWSHRISHYNRFFWATHVVHHSASHYNLTVAFRQSWVQHFKTIFFIPVALMGFHPVIFFVASQLSTLYQFWVHTEMVGKLHPFIERYFGTPSNHRVHHGSQEKYLDKNFGATLMIWDHIFGSFQYEEEQPVYGITSPIGEKMNPFLLNFHEYQSIYKDMRNSSTWREALFFLFASPAKIYRYKQIGSPKKLRKETRAERLLFKTALVLTLLMLVQMAVAQQPNLAALPTPKSKNLLFFLQRTPDANTVIYEVNYKKDGEIDQENPVKGSWIRYEEGGRYKDLTTVEKKMAYGVKCKALGAGAYEIRLVSYKKMPLYLLKSADQKYHIYIKDEGKNLLLKRIFVKVNGGSFWFPKIAYVDLFTIHCETGAEMMKRVNL